MDIDFTPDLSKLKRLYISEDVYIGKKKINNDLFLDLYLAGNIEIYKLDDWHNDNISQDIDFIICFIKCDLKDNPLNPMLKRRIGIYCKNDFLEEKCLLEKHNIVVNNYYENDMVNVLMEDKISMTLSLKELHKILLKKENI